MKKFLLAVALTALSSQSWGALYTVDDCTLGTLTVFGGANPTDCEGLIEADPGGANDSEDVLNNEDIFTDDTFMAIAFTGFFYDTLAIAAGSNYWDFAQKQNQGGPLETDIDLGLSVTEAGGTATWSITGGALGAYEAAVAVIKSGPAFDAFLISDSLGLVTGGSFDIDQRSGAWSHFALLVGGVGVPPDPGVPAPGSLPLLILGLTLLGIGRRVQSRA